MFGFGARGNRVNALSQAGTGSRLRYDRANRLEDYDPTAQGQLAAGSTARHTMGALWLGGPVRRSATALAVVIISIVALAGEADAEDSVTVPAPKLAFAGHAKPVLRLVDGDRVATATVVVSNTGTADANGVTFVLLEDGAAAVEACGVGELTVGAGITEKPCDSTPQAVQLSAGATRRFSVTFHMPPTERLRDPLFEEQSTVAGVAPALTEVTVSRLLSNGRLWWPVWAALMAAALFTGLGVIATRIAVNRDPVPAAGSGMWVQVQSWAIAKIFTASSWTFKDSWATSIAALGGVLGTVLGSTGFFTDVLPGVSAGRFTGFSLVFGGLALLAPIVYTALGRRHAALSITVGTVAGLLVASAVTVAAVAGELATLGLLVHMSDAASNFQALCFVGLAVAGAVVILYAVRSARWLSLQPVPATGAAVGAMLSPAPSGYSVASAGVP